MGWAIGSRGDPFVRASLRLGLIYLALTAALIIAVSTVLYLNVNRNLDNQEEVGGFTDDAAQARFVAKTMSSLRTEIFAVDAGLLVIVAGGSLALARRTLRPVQRSVDAQKVFVSNASHELRTPLAILKAHYQVAARSGEPLPGEHKVFLDEGLQEIDRMSRIVEDLLMLSRIDAHEESLTVSTFDVGAAVNRTADRLRLFAEQHAVTLKVEGEAGVKIRGDEEKLEQAIVNVLKNAIEHSLPGSVVCVRLRYRGRKADIQIEDRGDGIAADDLPHIFERFYRAKNSRRPSNGNGLGLSIAHWIVSAHRGTVRVTSAPGAGTTVDISLPAASPFPTRAE